MKSYYLLELIPVKIEIHKKILYKTEFTRPFCIFNIVSRDTDLYDTVYFVLTDNADYLYEFFYVESVREFFELCNKFYNKGNFADGLFYYTSTRTIYLTSKNFDKYYSFNSLGKQENYNNLVCDVVFNYDKKENKKYFFIEVKPYFILSKNKSNEEYILIIENYMRYFSRILHDNHEFKINQFKHFNTFRDLVLHCIELDINRFTTKYKHINEHVKSAINEYYDILIDVAKGIEL